MNLPPFGPATRRALIAVCLVLPLALTMTRPGGAQKQPSPGPLTITPEPIPFDRDKPEQTRFGKLEWLGSLRLTSQAREFGGYSGLAVSGDGARLLAVSDTGTWLAAGLQYRGGRMHALTGARSGELRGLGGKPLARKFDQDAEAIAMAGPGAVTGTAYVSFERNHRIAVHTVTAKGIGPARRLVRLPGQIKSAASNEGLEGITMVRAGPAKGALLAFTEDYLDEHGDHIGWLIGLPSPKRSSGFAQAGGPAPGRLALRARGGFAITDLASLANGDIVVLERRFRFSEGVKMRLSRVKAADLKPGAVLEPEVLLEADDVYEIDNMEGLAAHRDGQGRDILTVISDDNFNRRFQRTLLIQFAIAE